MPQNLNPREMLADLGQQSEGEVMKEKTKTLRHHSRMRAVIVFAIASTMATVGISAGPASAASKAHKFITIGGMFPFTGSKSLLGTWGSTGVKTGVWEVNNHGGVLGKQLKAAFVDDAADAVDALPAFRKLMLSKPSLLIGPYSPTIEAVQSQFKPNNVVDFMIGGLTTLDTNTNPWLFRTSSSDSNEAIAMAYYAKSKGFTKASLIFDNSDNSQGFIPPLKAALKALGIQVLDNETLVPGQSSYSSELTNAFSGNPNVIFDSMDATTAATLFASAQSLGYTKSATWVGDDLQSAAAGPYVKSFGADAPTNLVAALPSALSATNPAYNEYLRAYIAANQAAKPYPTNQNAYDSIIIASLAMTMANSTDPKVWVKDVKVVASPPGVQCYTYVACITLLKKHKAIDYQGAAGDDNFNKYNNVFSGFDMEGFDASGNNVLAAYVTSAQLATVVAKE
jgi:ABC-type branched-subunit amino acid transport system substrate-binding protein